MELKHGITVILYPDPRKHELLDGRTSILESRQRLGKKEKECGRREGAWILPAALFFFLRVVEYNIYFRKLMNFCLPKKKVTF